MLESGLKKIVVGLGWKSAPILYANDFELDLIVLMLGEDGLPVSSEEYVFFDFHRECKNVSVNWKSATSLKEPPLG